MSYKRVVKKKGKSYGPYIYESYRDESGKVKKRYLGKLEDKKVSVSLFFLVGFLIFGLVVGSGYTTDVLFNEGKVSGNFVDFFKDSFSFVKDGITGLVVDDEPVDEPVEEVVEDVDDEPVEEVVEEADEEPVDELVEEVVGGSGVEEGVSSVGGDISETEVVGDSDVTSVSELNETEVVGDKDEIIVEEGINETLGEEVNETVIPEINETLINESIVNETIINESIVNETIINESIVNETVEEINETLINESIVNETIINETVLNETIINETIINETLVNISQVNVSTLQYRAVINRPVKWLKKIDISDGENLTIELPKDAENISVLTNEEVGEAFDSIGDYGEVVNDADREEVVSGGLLTGNVALDIREGQGLLVRFWNWLTGFTISGNVILEEEISDEISDTENATIVKLENIISDESEVGIEYYTEAPQANETNLSNGKRVVVSAPDELNYTEILAYAMVDGLGVRVNDSRLKLYWYASREDAVAYGYINESVLNESEIVELNESEDIIEDVENVSEGVELNESVNESEVVGNETDVVELNESETINESGVFENVSEDIELNESKDVVEESNESFESVLTGNVVLGEDNESALNETEVVGNETEIVEDIMEEVESFRIEVGYVAYDFDSDGFVDYIEWIVPHLSEQVYDIVISEETSFSSNITVDNGYSHLTVSDVAPYDSLVGYWGFDGDDYEFSQFFTTDAQVGSGLNLDGDKDYISVPPSDSLNSNFSEMTVSFWIKPDLANHNRLFDIRGTSAGTTQMGVTSAGLVFLHTVIDGVLYNNDIGAGGEISSGGWYMITFVYNGTNWNYYRNESFRAAGSDYVGSVTSDGTSEYMYIGDNTANQGVNGTLDEFKIWNRSLSSTEISNLYNNESMGISDFNRTGLVGEWHLDNYTELGFAEDTSGMGNNGSIFMTKDAVSYDFSLNNYDGVYYYNAMSVPGLYGNSFSGGGIKNNIEVSSPDFHIASNITWGAWIKPSIARTNDGIISHRTISGDREGYNMYVYNSSDQIRVYCSLDNGTSSQTHLTIAGKVVNPGEWHQYVCIYNGTHLYQYLDGVLNTAPSAVPFSEITYPNDDQRLEIGKYYSGYDYLYFSGLIDEVMVFNSSLNSTQISEIYNNQSSRFVSSGTIEEGPFDITPGYDSINFSFQNYERNVGSNISTRVGAWDVSLGYNTSDLNGENGLVGYWNFDSDYNDSSGNGNDGTGVDDVNLDSAGVWNNSASFDGAGDYITIPGGFNYTQLTISAWINPATITGDGYDCIYDDLDYASDKGFSFMFTTTYNTLRFYGGNDNVGTTATGITPGNWYHLVATFDGSDSNNATIYINGVANASKKLNALTDYTSGTVDLGVYSRAYELNGSMDEVMIFNRSLASDEIKELYIKGRANYAYADYQNFSDVDENGNLSLNVFDISTATTKILPEIKLVSDGYSFYTPLFTAATNDTAANLTVSDTLAPLVNILMPDNDTTTSNTSVEINVSIVEENLGEVKFNWNGTNTTLFEDSLVLMMNFDNRSSLGENSTYVVDVSGNGNNGTVVGDGDEINASAGKYNGGLSLDGSGDYVDVGDIGQKGYAFVSWVYFPSQITLASACGELIKYGPTSSQDAIVLGACSSYATSETLMIMDYDGGLNYHRTYIKDIINSGWHHIIINWNSTDSQYKFFIDGVAKTVYAGSDGGDTLLQDVDDLDIGGNADYADFNGIIDEVRIYNRSLSTDEIQQLYFMNLNKFNSTQWYLYSNQSLNSTDGLVNGDYSYYASAKDVSGNENLTEIRSLSVDSVAPQISYVSPENDTSTNNASFSVNASIDESGDVYAFTNLNSGLVGWWTMDDVDSSGDVIDMSGYGNNGSAEGDAVQVDSGKFGKGFSFDGAGDYVATSTSVGANDNLSILGWVNLANNINREEKLWALGDNDQRPQVYKSSISGDDLVFTVYGSNPIHRCIGASSFIIADVLPANNWVQVGYTRVANYSGTYANYTVYVNGVEKISKLCNGTLSNNFKIGSNYVGTGNFNGSIDDVLIFNRSLSASEISELYNASEGYYATVDGLSEGVNDFKTYAVDSAGNVNSTETRVLNYDSVDPTLSVFSPVNTSWYNSLSVLINVSSSESGTGMIVPNLDSSLISWWRMDDVGSELVVDGGAESGTTASWSGLTGVTTNDSNSGSYSFYKVSSGTITSGLMPVDPDYNYTLEGWFRSNGTGGNSKLYFGFSPYDENQVWIQNKEISAVPNTETTLYEACSSGDKTVKIVNGTNWYDTITHEYMAFNVDDSGAYTDLPNRNLSNINIESVTDMGSYWEINFTTTVGVSAPAGTKVRMHTSGAGYMYSAAGNVDVPNNSWTKYSVSMKGENLYGPAYVSTWWPGTRYVKVLGLMNYAQDDTYQLLMDDVSFVGPDVLDYMGNNGGMKQDNASQTSSGKFGRGFEFDGDGDYVNVGDIDTNVTFISFWMKFTGGEDVSTDLWSKSSSHYASLTDTAVADSVKPFFRPYGVSTSSITCGALIVNPVQWHHVVMFWNGTHQGCYYDGVFDSAVASTGSITQTDNNFLIGDGTQDIEFNGTIDEFMVFNRTLSSDEILALYNATALEYTETGLSEGSHTYDVYSQDLAANIVSSINEFGTDSVSPNVIFADNTASAGSQSSSSIFVNLSSSDANDHYAFTNFNNDLVGWWTMDDTNQSLGTANALVYDISGYGNNGTGVGNANQTSAGKFGKGFVFDGVGDRIIVASSDSLNSLGNNVSISMWAYATQNESDNTNFYKGLFHFKYNTTEEIECMIKSTQYGGAAGLGCYSEIGGASETHTFSSCKSPKGEWALFTFVLNDTSISAYKNGASCGTSALARPLSGLPDGFTTYIGTYEVTSYMWNGSIDDVLIFNRSLSEAEILALYNASANQYSNNFAGLAEGTYNFTGHAVDIVGNRNSTEDRNVVVDAFAVDVCMNITTPGVYTLSDDLSLAGTCINISSDDVMLDGNGKSITGVGGDAQGYGIYANGADNITITNFSNITGFDYSSSSGYAGIYLSDTNNSYINSITSSYNYRGIHLNSCFQVQITDNNISENSDAGVQDETGSANTIDNNDLLNNYNGVYFTSDSDIITNNQIMSMDISIYLFSTGGNNAIINNTIDSWGGIYLGSSADGNQVINNTITAAYYGLGVGSSNNNTITDNTIYANDANDLSGILFDADSSGNIITSNLINSETASGILFEGASSNNIINGSNIINVGGGTCYDYTYYCSGIVFGSTSTSNVIDGAIITPYGYGVYLTSSTSDNITNNTVTSWPMGNGLYANSISGGFISGNNFTGLSGGMYVSTLSSSDLLDNSIMGSGYMDGLTVNDMNNNVISGNVISSEYYNGMSVWGTSFDNVISGNNTIIGGTEGCDDSYYYCSGIIFDSASQFDTIDGNTITASQTNAKGIYVATSFISNSIINNEITSNDNGIYMVGGAANEVSNNTITSDSVDIYAADQSIGVYSFENTSLLINDGAYGSVKFLNESLYASGTDLSEAIFITSNNVFVNTTLDSGFNTTANITLNGLSLTEPKVLVDYDDEGSFEDCSSAMGCNNLSYAGGVFVFNVSHFTSYQAAEASSLFGCGTLDSANTVYTLENDISTVGTCFTITANNVTIDFAGFNITGDDSTGYGIYANGANNTIIRNGEIYDFYNGIYLLNNKNGNITNMTIVSNSYGLYLEPSSNNSVNNNNISLSNSEGIFMSSSSNNTFANNTLGSNGYGGITMSSGSNNIFTENTITSNLPYGVYIGGGSNNTLTNNVFGSNTYDEIVLDSSNNNTLTSNNISNCSSSGSYSCILLDNSDNNVISGGVVNFSGDGVIKVDNGADNNTFSNMTLIGATTYAVWDSSGVQNDYINLTISDSSWDYYFYGASPRQYDFSGNSLEFGNGLGGVKFLNTSLTASGVNLSNVIKITSNNVFVNTSLDSGFNTTANITLKGLSLTEPKVLVDYNDDGSFEDCSSANGCYNLSYDGGVFAFNVSHFTSYQAAEASSLFGCGTLDSANTVYTLESDISTTGTCFNVTANNVTLDMNGYNITGDDGESDYGVSVNGYNDTTIKDGEIYGMGVGISSVGGSGGNFTNMTINSNIADFFFISAMDIQGGSNNSITNNDVNMVANGAGHGIRLISTSNNIIRSNIANSNYGVYDSSGISLSDSYNNDIINNTVNLNNYYGIKLSSSSYNNDIINNTVNSNHDGIYLDLSSNNNTLTNITANSNYYGIRFDSSSNNTLTNITANSNHYGILLGSSSNNNTLTDITANSSVGYGIRLGSSSNNILTDITANSNGDSGVYIFSSYNNTLINTNIWNCSTSGSYSCIYVDGSDNNVFSEGTLNLSGAELIKLTSGAENNTFSNMTLIGATTYAVEDNAGVQNDYDNLTISDSTWDYYFNGASPRQYDFSGNSLEFETTSGSVKFLNTSLTASGANLSEVISVTDNNAFVNSSLDSGFNTTANITLKGLSLTEPKVLVDYNDDGSFEDCTSANGCYNLSYGGGVFVFNVSHFTSYQAGEASSLFGCGTLDSANTVYTLESDLSSAGTCFTITANNVTLDMNGYNITGDDSTGNGVYVDGYNETTIRNGEIYDFDVGVYLLNNKNNNITNITANSMTFDIYSSGIYLESSANNTLTGITIDSNTDKGIYLLSSSNNTLTNITAESNYDGIYFSSSSNNTLTNIISNSNNNDGIILYSSSNNNILTNITSNSNMRGTVLFSNSNNNTLTNITASSNYYGIYFDSSSNNTLTSITANSNDYHGIEFDSSSNNKLDNSNVSFNDGTGIYFYSVCNNNTISNNVINQNQYLGIVAGGSGHIIINNTLDSNSPAGLEIDFSDGIVANNTFSSNQYDGIYMGGASNNILTNNNIWDCSDPCIYVDDSDNNVISGGVINLSGTSLIKLISGSENNTFSNMTLIGAATYAVEDNAGVQNDYDNLTISDSTWDYYFYGASPRQYDFSGNSLEFETTSGSVKFLNTSLTASGANLSEVISVTDNNAFVNSSLDSGFNTTANITLKGIGDKGYATPIILRDGIECNSATSPACYNLTSLIATNVIFNVSSWTNYSIGEGDTSAPTINSVTITPSSSGLGQTINITANVTDDSSVGSVWVGVTVGGSQINYTMTNTSEIFNYSYTNTWTNGTYSVTVYANDSLGNVGSNSSGSFDIYNDNITVQIRTLEDSYQTGQMINLTDPPEFDLRVVSGPVISNVYTDPEDVWPGDEMLISADVSDAVGVKSVEVEMPHEEGVDVLDMGLVSGDEFDGTWQTIWDVHDTLELNYTSIVRAENFDGEVSYGEVGWSDRPPTCDLLGIGSTSYSANVGEFVSPSYIGPNCNPILQDNTSASWNTMPTSDSDIDCPFCEDSLPVSYSGDVYCRSAGIYYIRYVNGVVVSPVATLTCNAAASGITYTEFADKGETTNLTVLNLTTNTAVSDLILDSGVGKISFKEDVILNESFDIDSVVSISVNSVSIDSTLYGGALNKSAEITMKTLGYGYPKILKDGVECSDCNIISWDASTKEVVFNVTSFSEYTAAEANQSKVQNNGTNNISFYLLMKTQWLNLTEIEDDTEDEASYSGTCTNPTNVYDENWSTSGTTEAPGTCDWYVNYTIPSDVASAVLEHKQDTTAVGGTTIVSIFCWNETAWKFIWTEGNVGLSTINSSVLDTCLTSDKLQLKIEETKFAGGPMSFYEEKVWWTKWQDEDIVINDTTARTVNASDLLKLDTLWNAQLYNSSNLSSGDGAYRVYVALQDDSGNVLSDNSGNDLSATFNFTLDNAVPYSVELNSPADDASIADSANDVSFNWTATDALDSSLTCNLTVDSVVEGENVVSANNTMVDYTVNDLAVGDHEWNVGCWDDAGNSNVSESWNVSIYVSNTAPNNPTPVINSTDGTNKTLQDLNCYATISDPDGDALNVSVQWYKDGVLNDTINYTGQANGTAFVGVLDDGNTTKADVWSCGLRVYDGALYSDWVNSSNLTIVNSVPTVNLSSPVNGANTTNRTPTFIWIGNDGDGDDLRYDINISLYYGEDSQTEDNRTETDLDSLTYTPSSDLQYLFDKGYHYVWKVRVSDGEVYSEWTPGWNISIKSLVSMSLSTNDIYFGNLAVGESNNTDEGLSPFVIENDGTVYINVSVNSSALWGTQSSDSEYYQFKADNDSTESNSFDWLSSVTNWFNMPLTGYVVGVNNLSYVDSSDTVEVDINITVPANEEPGIKNSTIVFLGELAE